MKVCLPLAAPEPFMPPVNVIATTPSLKEFQTMLIGTEIHKSLGSVCVTVAKNSSHLLIRSLKEYVTHVVVAIKHNQLMTKHLSRTVDSVTIVMGPKVEISLGNLLTINLLSYYSEIVLIVDLLQGYP